MTPTTFKVISYKRVSTKSQGDSGLGMEAQESYIQQAIKSNGWELVAEFEDPAVSGGMRPEDRPGLAAAIKLAKQTGAAILAAKVDRFSRDVEDMARLIKLVNIKVATMPTADKFQLHLYASLAEQERDFIKSRTREALASLQARADAGEPEAIAKIERRRAPINRNRTAAAQQRGALTTATKARDFANRMRPLLIEIKHDNGGVMPSLVELAARLTCKGVKTAAGADNWNPTMIKRVLARMKEL